MKDKEKQIWKNCKHHKADMDGVYCAINKGAGYNHCVLPHRTSHCKYFEGNIVEKQIEEMAKDLCIYCHNMTEEQECLYSEHEESKNKCWNSQLEQAKTLYNAGYRKIDKDSVVLSRELYNEMVDDVKMSKEKLAQIIDSAKEKGSKETAQTVLEEFICKLVNLRLITTKEDMYYELLEVKDSLLKEKYGVGIKE